MARSFKKSLQLRYLLDTNVVSELRTASSGRAAPGVVDWSLRVPTEDLAISVITLLELEIGVIRMERRDPTQGVALRDWLSTQVAPAFSDRILPITADVARLCAPLHVPDPRPERDALIAATAAHHKLIVVTRNSRDFAPLGVELFDPWS